MRKIIVCLISAMMIVSFLLSGCQGDSGSQKSAAGTTVDSKTGTEQTERPVTITYISRQANPDVPKNKFFMDRLTQFQKENPHITVEDLSIVELDAYNSKLKASIASGDPINIFAGYGYTAEFDWAKNNVTKDLTPIINSGDWTGPKEAVFLAPWDYSARGLEGIYGVPTSVLANMFFVNTRILEECGLQIPETWEDVLDMIPTLRANGYTPVSLGAKTKGRVAHWHSILGMKMYGTELKDDLVSGKESWNGEKSMNVLNTFKSFVDAGMFGDDAISIDMNGQFANFQNGKAAMLLDLQGVLPRFKDMEDYDAVEVMVVPYFEANPEHKDLWWICLGDGYSITVDEDDEKYDAVVKLLKYMTSKDCFEALNKALGGGVYPVDVTVDVNNTERLTKKFMEIFAQRTGGCDEFDVYFEMPNMQEVVRNELQTLFVGRSTKEIADVIQGELDKYNNSKK
jgi:raffinose/stachyose/melibiose transport system substrate-binding protein